MLRIKARVRSILYPRKYQYAKQRLQAFRAMRKLGPNSLDYTDIARRLCFVNTGAKIPRFITKHYIDSDDIDLLLRQKVMNHSMYKNIFPMLMLSKSPYATEPVAIPLPSQWCRALQNDGIQAARVASWFMWHLQVLRYFLSGVKHALTLLFNNKHLPDVGQEGYAVLVDAPHRSVPPHGVAISESLCFARWYGESSLRGEDEKTILVQIPGQERRTIDPHYQVIGAALPRMKNYTEKLVFSFHCILLLLTSISQYLLGRWYMAALMYDLVDFYYMQSVDKDKIAKTYVFNNASWICRPLWTYAVENFGSKIVMAYFSTNIEPLLWKDGATTPNVPGVEIMNWPEYAVWDEAQANFLRKSVRGEPKFHICGEIYLEDSGQNCPDMPKNSIAVFGVTPFSDARLTKVGLVVPCHDVETAIAFLMDVYASVNACGGHMILKVKRQLTNINHPKYVEFINHLSERPNVIIVDPHISARKVIEKSACVVSFPYTSTSIIARNCDVPCIYYDPTATLSSSLERSHGVPMMQDKDALTDWVREII